MGYNECNILVVKNIKMKIPPKREIEEIKKELDVLPIITKHCDACARKARGIGEKMLKIGKIKNLNLDLLEFGARLHDLAKIVTIEKLEPEKFGALPATKEQISKWKTLREKYSAKGHELQVLAEIMRKRNYEEFADFLLSLGWTGNPTYLDASLEVKIIHYTDWTLHGEEDMDFKEKVEYLIKTYKDRWTKKSDEWWENFRQDEYALEQELLSLVNELPT